MSFGALAKAQETLTKHGQSEKKSFKDSSATVLPPRHQDSEATEATERLAGKKDRRDFSRSSKHAPTELSSKKAVSRKREIVPTQKRDIRDPRFESVTGPLDEQKTKKNYAFLDEYRDSEMSALKSTIRTTKDTEAKEKLKRALVSMESRKKAQQAKEQQQEVLRAHRSKEKESIQQGKKPFYLKKGEQKKLALVKRFEGMKGKQVDRAIERRRKKQARRERKEIPEGRRGV